jgi:hypothetical protein
MTDNALDLDAALGGMRLVDQRAGSRNCFPTLFGRGDAVARPDSDSDGIALFLVCCCV